MLIPCRTARAIFLIHLFSLQLCVAMRGDRRSGSSSSVPNPGVHNPGHINDQPVVVLRVVPHDRFFSETKYYVTLTKPMDKMTLKLTHVKDHAFPIVDSSGLGDHLQVPLSDLTFEPANGDAPVQLETRQLQDPVALASGRLQRLEIIGGTIVVPERFMLWCEMETQLLFVKNYLERVDRPRFVRMRPIDAEWVENYGKLSKERSDQCKKKGIGLVGSGILGSLCLAMTISDTNTGYLSAMASSGILLETARRVGKMIQTAGLVWMHVGFPVGDS